MYEHRKRMGSTLEFPFQIVCRKCGSNMAKVEALDNQDLEISCLYCGFTLSCGSYMTVRENPTPAKYQGCSIDGDD